MVGGEAAKRVRPFKEMRYKNNLLFLYRMTQKGKGFAKQNLYSRQNQQYNKTSPKGLFLFITFFYNIRNLIFAKIDRNSIKVCIRIGFICLLITPAHRYYNSF